MVLGGGSLLRQACDAKAASTKQPRKTVQKTKATAAREETSSKPEDIAKVVDRNIMRFFGTCVPSAAIDVVQVDGLTMRERMVRDRTELLKQGRSRGDPSYFGDIKKLYMAALTGIPVVQAGNDAGDVPEALAIAMQKARARQRRDRKREPIVHYLWQCRAPLNQRSVLDLMDLLVETQQHNCMKQAMLVQEVFSAFSRLTMLEKFHNEIQPVLPILEQSLLTIFRNESKTQKGYGFDIFWSRYKSTAALFLKVEFVERVLGEDQDWSRCTSELSALATGSALGIELFMPLRPEIVACHLNSHMRSEANKLKDMDRITSAIVNDRIAAMVVEADRLKMDRLVAGRIFHFEFMGHVVQLRTHTAIEQARHHIAAVLNTLAVQHSAIPQMQVERMCVRRWCCPSRR